MINDVQKERWDKYLQLGCLVGISGNNELKGRYYLTLSEELVTQKKG